MSATGPAGARLDEALEVGLGQAVDLLHRFVDGQAPVGEPTLPVVGEGPLDELLGAEGRRCGLGLLCGRGQVREHLAQVVQVEAGALQARPLRQPVEEGGELAVVPHALADAVQRDHRSVGLGVVRARPAHDNRHAPRAVLSDLHAVGRRNARLLGLGEQLVRLGAPVPGHQPAGPAVDDGRLDDPEAADARPQVVEVVALGIFGRRDQVNDRLVLNLACGHYASAKRS